MNGQACAVVMGQGGFVMPVAEPGSGSLSVCIAFCETAATRWLDSFKFDLFSDLYGAMKPQGVFDAPDNGLRTLQLCAAMPLA